MDRHNASVEGYAGPGGSAQARITQPSGQTALPFTGYDAGLALTGAALMFAFGVALRAALTRRAAE